MLRVVRPKNSKPRPGLFTLTPVGKLKFSKEYLQRLTKPIPKKDPLLKEKTDTEIQSQPRHPTGFTQYCTNCGRNQLFRKDTLGWKHCTVCHGTAPDRSQSPI